MENISYFQKHLYFEKYPNSKEFQLNKCNKILEMIAVLKDRNASIIHYAEKFYGNTEDGKVNVTEHEFNRYQANKKTIKRLESYYNNCLSKVSKF